MQENLRTFLVRGASGSAGIKAAGAGIAFGTHLLAARLLGVEPYGVYILAITWLQLLTLPAILGMDVNLLRFVPTYRVQQDWPRLKGILRWSANLATLNGLAVAGVAALVVWGLSPRLGDETALALWCVFVVVPFAARLTICRSALQGLHRVVLADLPERIVAPFLFILLLFLVYRPDGAERSASLAVMSYGVATAVALMLATILLKRRVPGELDSVKPRFESGVWFRSSLPLLFVSGIASLLKRADILMVGAMVSAEAAGIYAVVVRVCEILAFGVGIVNAPLLPLISKLYAEKRMSDLQRIVTLCVLLVSAISLFMGVFFALFGERIIGWFGTSFTVGITALYILIIGQMVSIFCGPVGGLMSVTGGQREAARALSGAAVANICLNLILIPHFGMIGAAVATAVALAGWNIVLVFQVRRRMGIHPTVLGFLR